MIPFYNINVNCRKQKNKKSSKCSTTQNKYTHFIPMICAKQKKAIPQDGLFH